MSATQRLRELLGKPGALVAPGAYDALSARLIEQAGFAAVYMTGFGAAASLLGVPDLGLLTMDEMVQHARHIAAAVSVPVIADADNGYGNALNVYRTVREMERAGVAGIHLEDQALPKRCGHLEGKELVPTKEFLGKLKAALDARLDPAFVIIARTDARTVLGFEEAITRARLYLEAGADMVFVESPLTVDEVMAIPRLVGGPAMINMAEGGKTPPLSVSDLERAGYRLIIFPIGTLLAAASAVRRHLAGLKATGTFGFVPADTMGFRDITDVVGLRQLLDSAAKYRAEGG